MPASRYRLYEQSSSPPGFSWTLESYALDALHRIMDPEALRSTAVDAKEPDSQRPSGWIDPFVYDAATGSKGKETFSDPAHRLRVNRTAFQQLMEDGLVIEKGKRFERFESIPDGVRVFFEDGSHVDGSLLVAADGVHSKGPQTLASTRHAEFTLIFCSSITDSA